MGSVLTETKCPHCGCYATEDFYYNTDEMYVYCQRCGYNYSKTIKSWNKNVAQFEEDIHIGYGVFTLTDNNEQTKVTLMNSPLTEKQFEKYLKLFLESNIDQEKSYLVTYEAGVFKTLFGLPPEKFFLPFEEYVEYLLKKYSDSISS